MKRIISIFLIVAMLATTLPLSAIAAESDNGFSISASGGANTISVTEKTGGDDDTPVIGHCDILSLSADARDNRQRLRADRDRQGGKTLLNRQWSIIWSVKILTMIFT